jgi:hypothetical protein
MANGDVNTARLLLTVLDDPAWKDDLGRLATGFIARQQRGAWSTTTANLWGGLALEKFSARFEATPVAGTTRAGPGRASANVDWAKVERIKPSDASGAPHQTTLFGAPASPGTLRGNTMWLPWGKTSAPETLSVTHQGPGKPWLTLQSLAAVELKAPLAAGYQITRSVTPVEQADKKLPPASHARRRAARDAGGHRQCRHDLGRHHRPGARRRHHPGQRPGARLEIATQGEKRSGSGWPAFEERSFEAFRSYYEYLPKGVVKMQYTVRLNNVGDFALPPTRVEAMYAPEMFGEAPNARVKVEAAK